MFSEIFKQMLRGFIATAMMTQEGMEAVIQDLARRYNVDPAVVETTLLEVQQRIEAERKHWQQMVQFMPQILKNLRPKSPTEEIEELTQKLTLVSQKLDDLQMRMHDRNLTPASSKPVHEVGEPDEISAQAQAKKVAREMVWEAAKEAAKEAARETMGSVSDFAPSPKNDVDASQDS